MINSVCKGDDVNVLLDEGGGECPCFWFKSSNFLAAVQTQLVFNFPKIK